MHEMRSNDGELHLYNYHLTVVVHVFILTNKKEKKEKNISPMAINMGRHTKREHQKPHILIFHYFSPSQFSFLWNPNFTTTQRC